MNWKQLISEIQAAGFSQNNIAERLGRSQAWVSAVAKGSYTDLRWGDGQALIALHAEICTAPAVHAPETQKTEEAA